MNNLFKVILITTTLTSLPLSNIYAAKATGNNYSNNSIIIEGNSRIEKETIESYLASRTTGKSEEKAIDESLKRLFATGLFANVDIFHRGNNLVVKVVENPVINKVAFEGNDKLKSKDLQSEILSKPRSVYTKINLQQDVNRIIELYNKSGRFAISVNPKVIKLSHNRINLVFEIEEGEKTPIKKILFAGNKNVSDSKLSSVINTKESRWYRFFSSSDNYDAARIEYDKEVLRRYYNSIGYADFKVISASADLSPARNSFIITFSLEEGEKYKFGKINITSKLPNVNVDELKNIVFAKENDIYNLDDVEETVDALTKNLNDKGIAFVNIEPNFDQNLAEKLINLNFMIEEGRKAYVNKINITGNVRTLDKVIRREFRLSEGDPYNASLAKRSEQRIQNLDFFDKVEFTPTPTADPEKIDINVNVAEKSTAKLNFGGGYSTVDKAIAQISFSEDNFLGRGQNLRVGLQRSKKTMDIDLSITEPYFMGKELSTGVDIYRSSSDRNKRVTPYDSLTYGTNLRAGYNLNEYLTHDLMYVLKKEKISKIEPTASHFIKEQAGEHVVSAINHSLTYDKTNLRMKPSKGYLVKFEQELAGLGGTTKYFRNELNSRYYYPIKGDSVIFQLSGKVGHITSLDKEVRISDRFFIGDIGPYGLRGFAPGGIGPRSKVTDAEGKKLHHGDPLGGNIFYTATANISFPFGLPEELDISGHVFTDIGSLFKVDVKKFDKATKKNQIWDDRSVRVSAGAGIVWLTKIGPIRMDWARPIKKKKYDKSQTFHLQFSTNF